MVPAAAVVWVTAVATGDVSGDGVGPLWGWHMAGGRRAAGGITGITGMKGVAQIEQLLLMAN